MNKVEAPALIRQGQHWRPRARSNRTFATFAATHRQAFFAVKPLCLLAVDRDAVSAQQNVQPAIAKPTPLMRQFTKLLAKLRIITAARAIAYARAISRNHPARPPFADLKQSLKMPHSFPFCGGRHHFFDSRSFRPALSSIVSAKSFLSCVFSASSARSRFASDTSRPPYLDFQL